MIIGIILIVISMILAYVIAYIDSETLSPINWWYRPTMVIAIVITSIMLVTGVVMISTRI